MTTATNHKRPLTRTGRTIAWGLPLYLAAALTGTALYATGLNSTSPAWLQIIGYVLSGITALGAITLTITAVLLLRPLLHGENETRKPLTTTARLLYGTTAAILAAGGPWLLITAVEHGGHLF